jgi:hypothetical protein
MQVKINKVKQSNNKVKDVRAKNSPRRSLLLPPRQRCQKNILMPGEWPARWKPQEEGVMNIAARFFPQLRNQGLIVLGEERQTTEGDADWLNSTPTRASFNDTC